MPPPTTPRRCKGRGCPFTRKAGKANTTFYSFFRRDVLMSVHETYLAHHPMLPGYSDWALVYALAASGRIVHDPQTVLRYNNARWDDMETAGENVDRFYADVGLPPDTRLYMSLLHFLDIYVLMFRQGSNLPPIEQYKAATPRRWSSSSGCCSVTTSGLSSMVPPAT